MSYTVTLQDENRNIISQLEKEVSSSTFDKDGLILLKYLDPYGDTVFNIMWEV